MSRSLWYAGRASMGGTDPNPAGNHPSTRRAPSRFSEWSPWMARGLLLLLLALTGWGVVRTSHKDLVEQAGRGEDTVLYASIAHDVRAGRSYYQAVAARLRESGYPMKSVFNWRMPTLAWLFSALPSDRAARGLLGGLSLLAMLAWFVALRRTITAAPTFLACVLLLGILAWPFVGEAYLVHETWAGVTLALSVAAGALGWRMVYLLAGLAALAFRELTLVYVAVAMASALRARRHREIAAWCAGLGLYLLCFLLHARAVAHHQLPYDRMQPAGWLDLGGWWFVLKTAHTNFWLIAAPDWITGLIWPTAIVGLAGWACPLGRRTSAVVLAYTGLFLIVGLPYNYLWGLLYAGLAPLGLWAAPAALRDLVRRALDRSSPPSPA